MIVKNIKDVIPGDIVGEDIIHKEIFLIKKGTELSKRTINLLKKREIEAIKVSTSEPDSNLLLNSNQQLKSPLPATNIHKARDTFFHLLHVVGYERRYGKLLNEEKDVEQLIQLFTDIHIRHQFIDMLYMLKSWDYYTFIHSFDVFVLGSLLAKRQGIQHLDSVALGYLFHDIGKIDIPQDILGKKGKLSLKEFEVVQNHTIKGEEILIMLGQNHIAHFARSHHERLDGTGYPDKLTARELPEALRILHIVDVYSALTLKRPYKGAIPAQEALQMFMQDTNKYDKDILYDFIEALAIYPAYSTVLLSDQTKAIINQVSTHTPILPVVKRIDQEQAAPLPVDFSLTISKLIDFQTISFQTRFKEFVNDLKSGHQQSCSDKFTQLVDGLQLEDIYTKIFLPAYWETTKMIKDHIYDQSQTILIELLEQLEREMKELNKYKCTVGIIAKKNAQHLVPLKIMSGLLHVECIFPVFIDSSFSNEYVERWAIENAAEHVCVVFDENTPFQKYDNLQPSELKLAQTSFHQLNQKLKKITGTQNRAIHFYDHIFSSK